MAIADGVDISSTSGEENTERASVDGLRFARTHSAVDKTRHLHSVVDTSRGRDRGWSCSLPKQAVRHNSARASEKSLDFKVPASWPVLPRGSFFLRRSLDKLAERTTAGGLPDAGDDLAVNSGVALTKLSSTAKAAQVKGSDVSIVTDSAITSDTFTQLSSSLETVQVEGSDISIMVDFASGDTSANLSSSSEATRAKGSDLSTVADSAASGQLTEPAPEPGLESDHNKETHQGDSQHDGKDACNQDAGAAGTHATATMADTERPDICNSINLLAKESCNEDATTVGTHATAMRAKAENDNLRSGIEHVCEDACNQNQATARTHTTAGIATTESHDLRDDIDIIMRSSVQSSAASTLARHSTSASLGDLTSTSAPEGTLLDAHAVHCRIHDNVQEHDEEFKPHGEDDAAESDAPGTRSLGLDRIMVNVLKEEKCEGVGMSEKEEAAKETAESTTLIQGSGTATHLPDAVSSGLAADSAIAASEEGSEDSFNVFGERDDTESRFRERVLELENTGGVTVFKSSARARLHKRQRMKDTRKTLVGKVDGEAKRADVTAQAVSTAALVANFLGFAGYSSIPEEDEEEDEEHNAWGEEDTSEKLQQRTLELEEARGLTMRFQEGPAKTNARARLAKKKQRPSNKQEHQFPDERIEAHGSESDDEEFDPWGEDDTLEKRAERIQQLETGRLLVNMATFSSPEAGDVRNRLAKKKKRRSKMAGNVEGSDKKQAAMDEPECTNTSQETGAATISGAAALVANIFAFAAYNPFGENHEVDEGPEEEHNAWGEEDTEEKLHQRALELEHARGMTMTYATSPAKTNARVRLAQKIRARATKNPQSTFPHKNIDQHEDGSAEKIAETIQEAEAARNKINTPTFQRAHAETNKSRDRLAKKKEKAKTATNTEEFATASADTKDVVTHSNNPSVGDQPGYFQGFSRLFFADADYDDFDEEWNMWGEADSRRDYLDRVAAFEDARKLAQRSSERSPRLDAKQHAGISVTGASAALASASDSAASQAEGAPPAKSKHAMKKFQLPVRAVQRMKRRA